MINSLKSSSIKGSKSREKSVNYKVKLVSRNKLGGLGGDVLQGSSVDPPVQASNHAKKSLSLCSAITSTIGPV